MAKKFQLDADDLLSAAISELYMATKTANFEAHISNAVKSVKLLKHRIDRWQEQPRCRECGSLLNDGRCPLCNFQQEVRG